MTDKNQQSPDFIGIGAMKAATSWIYSCLIEHPQICDRGKKELRFFDRPQSYSKGIEYYLDFFKDCPDDKIKGEYTPSYIFSKEAPKLIHEYFPNTKIIACLRNPVERAISQYKFNIYKSGRLSVYKDFSHAIRKDREVIDRGKYYEQLKRYFELFNKDNILVIIFEELKHDPQKEIQKIYDFLGVDKNFIPQNIKQKKNVTGSKKIKDKRPIISKILYNARRFIPRGSSREKILQKSGLYNILRNFLMRNKIEVYDEKEIKILDQDRQYLQSVYEEDIRKLEGLINKDLSFWK